jgi:hypothetical protein
MSATQPPAVISNKIGTCANKSHIEPDLPLSRWLTPAIEVGHHYRRSVGYPTARDSRVVVQDKRQIILVSRKRLVL